MGHRTNYAIRQGGAIRLFYSHWGALSVAQDLFWGPDHALAFITGEEEVDPGRWLDEVWCEGGAALNVDTKTLCLFGGEGISEHEAAITAYIALAGALWGAQGWSVRWAQDGIHDLAACVGADPALVEAKPMCQPVELDALGRAVREDERIYPRIISWRGADGAWMSAVDTASARDLLATGPALLDHLHQLVPVSALVAVRAQAELPLAIAPSEGLVIDQGAHTIRVHGYWPLRTERRLFASAWEGWTIDYQDGGLLHHYALLDQAPPDYLVALLPPSFDDTPPAPMSHDAALAYVAELLLEEEFGDPVKTIHALIAEHSARGERIEVNPHALRSPSHTTVSYEERRALVASALATLCKPPATD
jgi:hypothetical protein